MATTSITYKDAGVDIDAGDAFVDKIQKFVRSTYGPQVVRNDGGFGGMFELSQPSRFLGRGLKKPVLVAGTDGVGTKLKIAFLTGVHNTVGIDLVAMSVNDVLVQGAEPLFFLDYVASSKLDMKILVSVIEGVSKGCREAGCALLGGETAELPGFYQAGEYDLAGFAVGVVEKDKILRGDTVEPGDAVIGLMSSGLHSNGYSLARKVYLEAAGWKLEKHVEEFGRTLGEELLTPTKIYVKPVLKILASYKAKKIIKALAHITGGGLVENPPRVFPKDCKMVIEKKSWEVPPVFQVMQKLGNVPEVEMFRVFNMGVGMVMVVPPFNADAIVRKLRRMKVKAGVIGRMERGNGTVEMI